LLASGGQQAGGISFKVLIRTAGGR